MMGLVQTEKSKDDVERLFSFPNWIKHVDTFIIFKTENSTDCVQTLFVASVKIYFSCS